MPTKIYKSGLFISSFFPLYILLMIDNYYYFNSLEKLQEIYTFTNLNITIFSIVICLLILISIISVTSILISKQNESHKFKNILKTEDDILSYIVTYLLPLLSMDILETNSLLMNGALFLLLGFIYVKSNLIYLNPLFLIFGYNIFITQDNDIIISNYDIYDFKNNENERLKCRVLGYKLYLVKKGKRNT